MKKIALKSLLFTAVTGMCMATSCSDDGKTELKGVDVTNTELKAVLQQKGFVFNAEGLLLVDEKVTAVTTLDLSGCDLSDASGLDVFPNLTEVNLANNKFGFIFDFSVLPATITGVDLTGNEIYEYPGLVSVEVQENGDETVTTLYELKKLYLPENARYNCDEIVYFYTENKTADVKIQNAQGTLTAYNTLREVPDDNFRAYLQTEFPSLFDKTNTNLINIANRIFRADEASRGISQAMIPGTLTVESVEGLQYIMMNPSWKGTSVWLYPQAVCEMPYLKIKSALNVLNLEHIATGYLNLAEANYISTFILNDNPTIEHIDLSASTALGQRGVELEIGTIGTSNVTANNCPELKTVVLPRNAKYAGTIKYTNLPLLEEVDLSHFSGIGLLLLGNLPGLKNLTYFTPDGFYQPSGGGYVLQFGISADIYAFPETKAFLDAYHENCRSFGLGATPRITAYNWTQHYQ